jgi:diaminohydroxyphosphoribosylaminopyrimidine deaminase/5-amino-6-(5-phosphoribosylamino)uracil reductase
MLASGLVDELVIYLAPHIMGSETRGMFTTPDWQKIDRRSNLEIVDIRKIGADLRMTARPDR